MTKATLFWVDLEMTGLVPGVDKILEVAAIGTDWELNEICRYEGVVKVDEALMKERMVGPFWEANAESRDGLMAQNAEGKAVGEIERELIEFLDANFAKESILDARGKGKIILAGNSVHQDKKFIEVEMPKLNERLHYRILDVSAWKVYFEGAKLAPRFLKREAHRALDDIRGSIEELGYYRKFLKGE